jgi:phosphate transport system protein
MPGRHTLRSFDEDLRTLRQEVVDLAGQVGRQLERALEAFSTGDPAIAQEVKAEDLRADALHQDINRHVAQVLARQHAVADDLREILAAGRIAMHLERVGDYAKNTAKRTLLLSRKVDSELYAQFHWMGARVIAMLQRIVAAYEQRDAAEANVTWTSDAELDQLYNTLFVHVLDLMKMDSSAIGDGTQFLFIAKGLERAGDHLTDIAEEVYLMVTGEPLEGPRPKIETIVPL